MLSLQVLLVPLLVVVRVGSVTQVENKEASTGQSAGSHVGTIETGGRCTLKQGAPAAYKTLCSEQKTLAACAALNLTCVWNAAPSPPPATCSTSKIVAGFDIGGQIVMQPDPRGGGMYTQALPVAEGQAGYDQCRTSCCQTDRCLAWTVKLVDAALPRSCPPGKPCCWHKDGAVDHGQPCKSCHSSSFVLPPPAPPPAKGYWCKAGYESCEVCQYKLGGCTPTELNTTWFDCENVCDPRCDHAGCPQGYQCQYDGHGMVCEGPVFGRNLPYANLSSCEATCGKTSLAPSP